MFKRVLVIAFVFVVLLLGFSPGSAAQDPNVCLRARSWWPFPDGFPLGWFYYGPYPGTYVVEIAAHTIYCVPPAAPTETCPTCPHASKPISLATGNTYITQTDVSLPGLGGGLSLVRTWNSMWPPSQSKLAFGMFGAAWRSTYEEQIFLDPSDKYVKYARSDGSFWSFGVTATGDPETFLVAAPANVSATLVAGTGWALTFPNGERRVFDGRTGLLTAIIDRNGNATSVIHVGNQLVGVIDPASRSLTFNYGTGALTNLVTSVTSNFGVSLSYTYDSQFRLSQVTRPDQTTVTFTYSAASQITQVTDSNGKVLESHTYDSIGRGLTSSEANGVNSLTITYPQ